MWKSFWGWVGLCLLSHRYKRAQRFASKWKRKAAKAHKQLAHDLEVLTLIREEFNEASIDILERIESANRAQDEWEKVEESLNNEVKILGETLEDMALMRERTREQLKADVALSARQQASLVTRQDEE